MRDPNKFLDQLHIKIHALRMLKGYKASEFEAQINLAIADRYQDSCDECKAKILKNHYTQPQNQPAGFLGGLVG